MRRRDLIGGAAGGAMLWGAGAARAAGPWAPTRPVTLIVPLAPGSTADILARTMAEAWGPRLGQPVTVDNRPAAGGVVAMEQLKNAPPDGQVIGLVSQGTLVFSSFLTRTPRYDSQRDFAPIAMFSTVTNALVVPRTSPYATAGELAAAAKAQPGRLTYSSGGNGTSHHISMVLFGQVAGAELTHVPYRGAPAGITAVMTGEVASGCYNIPTVLQQIRAGELRPLAVTSARRSPFLPEVPSLQELGFAGYELTTWMGLAAPARTPEPAIARLAEETYRALDDQAVWAKLERQGFEPMPRLDPAGFAAFLDAEMTKWGPVIRASGAVAD
jgi:tripartite-type tricarboxylate transporter receptor subunit TctC